MEIKENHKDLMKNYALFKHLEIPFFEIKKMNKVERNYMYDVVCNSLETNRIPSEVMSANYKTSKAKLFTVEKNAGIDTKFKNYKISNIMNEIDIEIIYDSMRFNGVSLSEIVDMDFGIEISENQNVYVKTNSDLEDINRNDILFLDVFDKMYIVNKSNTIDAFELGSSFYMLNLKEYKNAE